MQNHTPQNGFSAQAPAPSVTTITRRPRGSKGAKKYSKNRAHLYKSLK